MVKAAGGTVCMSESCRVPARMGDVLRVLLVVAGGLALSWLLLVGLLAVARPEGSTLADAVRLLPDLVGLVRRLARDPAVPRSVRVTLWLLVGYLIVPFDLVPDFIPVLGWADDVVVVALALRRVVRVAGAEAVERHWQGSDAGLVVVRRLAGSRA
jgi:uncharacterized membrane protein YkvA (DUF1232 family)